MNENYEVQVLTDSISPQSQRLTTFVLRYPRFIHGEVLTHRCFSRNSQSSRAIPTAKLIEQVTSSPVYPIIWGKNQKGMSADQELSPHDQRVCRVLWKQSLDQVLKVVHDLQNFSVHKQVINRLLEPYSTITTVLTGTSDGLESFFQLRCSKSAQPEIRYLAERMKDAWKTSIPNYLACDDWHLPFVTPADSELDVETKKQISAARCARVSYLLHTGGSSVGRDLELCARLANDRHWSPFEHVVRPAQPGVETEHGLQRNLSGWVQYRAELEA